MKQRLQAIWLIVADICAFFCAFTVGIAITWWFRADRIGGSLLTWWHTVIAEQLSLYFIFSLLAIAIMAWRGHYTHRIPFWDELLQLIKLFILFGLVHGMVILLLKLPISRFFLPILWGSVICFLSVIRQILRQFLSQKGWWALPTVIIGTKQ